MKVSAIGLLTAIFCCSLLAQPAALPDLIVTSTTIADGRVSAVITNRGNGTSTIHPRTTLLIFEGSRPMREVDSPAPALRPGASATVSFDAIVPPGAQYQVMVDSDRRVDESNEGNNRTDNQIAPVRRPPVPPRPLRGVTVDPSLAGRIRSIVTKPSPDGQPRPVAAARFPGGQIVAFAENELLITTSNAAAVEALAARHGGKIMSRSPVPPGLRLDPTYVVRVNTAVAPSNPFGAREDGFAFSSERARNLLAIAMAENAAGAGAGINLIDEDQGFFEQKTLEGAGQDALAYDYMRTGGVFDVDVAGAWKALFQAGKTSSKPIIIGVVDRGFDVKMSNFTESDYEIANFVGTGLTDEKGGWHGTATAESAAGIANDGRGAAGPAGPVARIAAVGTGDNFLGSRQWGVLQAYLFGARIISMSFSGEVQRGNWFESAWSNGLENFEKATMAYQDTGVLLFASAGNDHKDIDAVNEDGEEAAWTWPCENRGVICVGGWWENTSSDPAKPDKSSGKIANAGSNFASGHGETIDIWGPWTTFVGDVPGQSGKDVVLAFTGTSAATPTVAGVAALIWAANPALTNMQVWDIMNRHAIKAGAIRRVHAYRAVREALMSTRENTPPAVQIVSPGPSASLSQAQPTEFRAAMYDVEDQDDCCLATWTIDGKLSGATHSFAQDALGAKVITVTIHDKGGKSATATVTAQLVNFAPTITIANWPQGTVAQGLPIPFEARVSDDTTVAPIPTSGSALCAAVVWTSDLDPGVLATGCTPAITFKTAGTHVVTATVTDNRGAPGSDMKTVGVVPAPTALEGSIIAPQEHSSFESTAAIVLSWASKNVVGTPQTHWSLTWNATGEKRAIATKVVGGVETFRIEEVFPEITAAIDSQPLTLRLTSSSGQVSAPSFVGILQRPLIH
jgi:serine protease